MLELLAATFWFWTFSTGFLFVIICSVYILLFTSYWWMLVLYIGWILYDRNTPEKGGRPIKFIKELSWWKYMKSYFNFKLITSEDKFQLDSKKNYIAACYPHGIYPTGTFAAFAANGYENLFPNHTIFTTVLNIQFWMPLIRELFLGLGSVSVSAASIKYLLKAPGGGNIVSILIGGGEEANYSRPGGKYKIILKKRKGFIKLALQLGCPIIPVFTFGEIDIFDQFNFVGLNFIKNIIKQISGVGLVIPKGKYLICPNKVPITTVVGTPIDVNKIEKPTDEDIENLHKRFTDALIVLFEKNKKKYLKNPQNAILEII